MKGRDEIIFATLQNAKSSSGTPLLRVSLLLMEHYTFCYGEDDRQEDTTAMTLISKNDDGSYSKHHLARSSSVYRWANWCRPSHHSDEDSNATIEIADLPDEESWDMLCYSPNGWWVTNGTDWFNDMGHDEKEEDSKDKKDNNSNDYDEENDWQDFIPDDRKMFLAPYETRKRAHAYSGNEGGQEETWYCAAAIVLSPYEDSSTK